MREFLKRLARRFWFDNAECNKLVLQLRSSHPVDLDIYRELYLPRTVTRLEQITGLSGKTIRKSLRRLEARGLIERTGNGWSWR